MIKNKSMVNSINLNGIWKTENDCNLDFVLASIKYEYNNKLRENSNYFTNKIIKQQ